MDKKIRRCQLDAKLNINAAIDCLAAAKAQIEKGDNSFIDLGSLMDNISSLIMDVAVINVFNKHEP